MGYRYSSLMPKKGGLERCLAVLLLGSPEEAGDEARVLLAGHAGHLPAHQLPAIHINIFQLILPCLLVIFFRLYFRLNLPTEHLLCLPMFCDAALSLWTTRLRMLSRRLSRM